MNLLSISTDVKIFDKNSAVAKRLVEYSKGLTEMHVVVFCNTRFTEISLAPNLWIYPTRSKIKLFRPLDAIRLGRFIITNRKITNITCQDPFFTALVGAMLKNVYKIPLEIQIHTDVGSPLYTHFLANRLRKVLALSYISKADTIRVVSVRIKDYLVKSLHVDEQKITVRPIAVNVPNIKNLPVTVDARKKYQQFKKIVLMASRLEKEKNIELAIKAWSEVVKKTPLAGLVIVGEGSEKEKLQKLCDKLDLTHSIVFEPWADHATLISYFKTADLFVMTSFYEGYGMTLIEAKSAGCPIVSTDVGVAKEVGAKIVGYDYTELAQAIDDILRVDQARWIYT